MSGSRHTPDPRPMKQEFYYAYYFSLDSTGVGAVDGILAAVAAAGKGCHHTRDWHEYGHVEPIQQAAEAAAAHVRQVSTERDNLLEALVSVRNTLIDATADGDCNLPDLLEYVTAVVARAEGRET